MNTLAQLEDVLREELDLLGYPPMPWIIESNSNVYDVAIIGGGMAGLTAAFALSKQGVSNLKVFDAHSTHKEGPWLNVARMRTLRSPKELVGPALGISSLTFQAWYRAQFGSAAWDQLYRIPTAMWMDYLIWYRKVLHLPVENEWLLYQIIPLKVGFELHFKTKQGLQKIRAYKIVLATGRAGFGGIEIPSFMLDIPKSFYAHTNEMIDFHAMNGKRIGIVGAGASGFDAAAVALEHHAASVDIIARRPHLPNINKFVGFGYPGLLEGFYQLNPKAHYLFMDEAFKVGIPPPKDALDRIKAYSNAHVWLNTSIKNIQLKNDHLDVKTNKKYFQFDYIILATGFLIDGSKQPELQQFFNQIRLWEDVESDEELDPQFGKFPYLGPSFEFMEKEPGHAPFLKDIYCFNHAAALSHGLISSDIPDISNGAERLSRGIASHFFLEDWPKYYERLRGYNPMDFLEKDFSFID